jgi:hypothetical protein
MSAAHISMDESATQAFQHPDRGRRRPADRCQPQQRSGYVGRERLRFRSSWTLRALPVGGPPSRPPGAALASSRLSAPGRPRRGPPAKRPSPGPALHRRVREGGDTAAGVGTGFRVASRSECGPGSAAAGSRAAFAVRDLTQRSLRLRRVWALVAVARRSALLASRRLGMADPGRVSARAPAAGDRERRTCLRGTHRGSKRARGRPSALVMSRRVSADDGG